MNLNLNILKKLIIPLGLAAVVFLSSCEEFLTEKPYTSYSNEQYFTSVDRLSMASLGIYESLSGDDMYGKSIPIFEATSDLEIMKTGAISTTINDYGQVCNYNYLVTNVQIEAIWKCLYQGINRANMVIANAHLVSLKNANDSLKYKMFVAEAKVLRAFMYLDLVRRWGDVPLRLEPADVANLFMARTPQTIVYDQMIKDLQEAIPDLPWYNDAIAMKGRMHKGAAMGLLARTCLFAGGYSLRQDGTISRVDDYQKYYLIADDVTKTLISSGKHSLNQNYENIFYKICQNELEPSESMFEIGMAYLNGMSRNASTIGANGSIGVSVKNNSNTYNCNPRIFTHHYARLKFDSADVRMKVSIANYYLNGVKFDKVDIPDRSSWGFAKWRRDWHKAVPQNWALSDVNNVVLRYSDVFLMRAEVLNELNNGPTTEAIELVNKVRRRGYGVDLNTANVKSDVPDSVKTSKEKFFTFLTDEYAREFLGEGGRRFHLIRWNLLKTKMDEITAICNDPVKRVDYFGTSLKVFLPAQTFKTGQSELYPIPYREIVENRGNLTNNPGFN